MASLEKEQKRMVGAQADIAQLRRRGVRERDALTGPVMGVDEAGKPTGEMEGPAVNAMMQALGNVNRAQGAPRLRLRARGFNPFGQQQNNGRQWQAFGANNPQQTLPAPPPPPLQ
jgi:hypothetical protein